MLVVELAGREVELSPIRFQDIQPGDTIVHLSEEENKSELWLGEVKYLSEVERIWYGEGRDYYRNEGDSGIFAFDHSNPNPDTVVVAEYFETVPTSTIWKV